MFDRIAPSYDALNRILSLRRDVAWRRRMAHFLPKEGPLDLLDLATGTGDQIIELKKSKGSIGRATGMDLSEGMLNLGREKLRELGWGEIEMLVGDVMDIPAPDDSFDVVTISFGIRNVLDVPKGLLEIQRVLKPGGTFLILECSMPKNAWLKKLYSFYFRHILPVIGGWVSGDSSAYRYLNETVESFPCGESLCDVLRFAGYQEVRFEPQTLGVATIYRGLAPLKI
jgi:demethylmenaquinone methyltransferase/2-methoxy-6-polyprenyl-1,4-benzoquinol methylase